MKEKIEFCTSDHTNDKFANEVRNMMPDEDVICYMAELFKVFGDSTRTHILMVLFESDACVCNICKVLNMTTSAVSHQLRILRQNKLVKAKKVGREVVYSLADEHVRLIFQMAYEHVTE